MGQIKAEYIDHMGTDLSVVNAARVSFEKQVELKEFLGIYQHPEGSVPVYKPNEITEGDVGLLRFLSRGYTSKEWRELLESFQAETDLETIERMVKEVKSHAEHWTPFAHTAISLRVAAPIPIRTQCFKHKVGLVENEESRRYIKSTPEIFIPEFRSKPEGSIKQGSGGEHTFNQYWQDWYKTHTQQAVSMYEAMIEECIAPEQARFILPQGAIVNWVWTGNLMAFANFYKKRIDPHAQQEIQEVARKVDEVIRPLFPVAWSALVD